jgi:hypothetical protein
MACCGDSAWRDLQPLFRIKATHTQALRRPSTVSRSPVHGGEAAEDSNGIEALCFDGFFDDCVRGDIGLVGEFELTHHEFQEMRR